MKPTHDVFPKELLTQSVDARLEYFKRKVVAHPHLVAADQALMNAIHHPAETSLVFLFGPTGVGKTTLLQRVRQRLTEEGSAQALRDPDYMPVVSVEATAPDTGNFNWKDYYKRAFIALGEPAYLVAKKVALRNDQATRGTHGRWGLFGDHTPMADLRYALEQCLSYRRPKAFLIDEAQHFTKVAGGRMLLDQMDNLKSLANMTQTVHVLIGTYEVMSLTRLSAQLARRSVTIHFPRYRFDKSEDIATFRSVLFTFQHYLPVNEPPDLVNACDYFYECCAGCVGTLKSWLYRALALALQAGATSVHRTHFEQSVDRHRMLQIASETKEGEEALRELPNYRSELRAMLGMPKVQDVAQVASQVVTKTANGVAVNPNKKHLTSKKVNAAPRPVGQRVAQRKPVRDRVGQQQGDANA
jgi:energy-coupling factor transporter ATP-binding protein EcfA2